MTNLNGPDPDFPDRPNHQDFYDIAKIVREHDQLCDESTEEESGFAKTFHADIRSIAYMAHQRAMRALDLLGDVTEREKLVMMWMDAFTAGQRFGEERAAAAITVDGQHRTGAK